MNQEVVANGRKNLKLLLRVVCGYGVFVNLWFAATVCLYFFVYGDNSSRFGLYPIIPAAIVAAAVVWIVRDKVNTMFVLAALTAPLGLVFAYQSFRFGLF